jgi:hypothetical protein
MGSHAAFTRVVMEKSDFISYVLDLIELLNNGWLEDGSLRPKHVATPNVYFNSLPYTATCEAV